MNINLQKGFAPVVVITVAAVIVAVGVNGYMRVSTLEYDTHVASAAEVLQDWTVSSIDYSPGAVFGTYSPGVPIPGHTIDLHVLVKNLGAGPAEGTTARLRIDLDTDGSWDITLNADVYSVGSAGVTGVVWKEAWIPRGGTHRFEICVDPLQLLPELNEDNNCLTQSIQFYLPTPIAKTTRGLLDVTFVGNKYGDFSAFRNDALRLQNYLLSREPFKSRPQDFTFHYVDNTQDLGCVKNLATAPQFFCNEPRVLDVVGKSGLPADKIVVIVNDFLGAHASGDISYISRNIDYFQQRWLHEFAHTFGLRDEYSFGVASKRQWGDRCFANCCQSAACVDWKDIPGAACIPGCGFTNWYRSSQESTMSGGWIEYFNAVSLKLLNEAIDQYTSSNDRVAPVVSLVKPLNGWNVNGEVLIQVDMSDDTGVVRSDFYLDDEFYRSHIVTNPEEIMEEKSLSPTSGRFYTQYWNTAGLVPGITHTFFVKAYDAQGNEGVSSPISVTILRKPLLFSNPLNNAAVSGEVVLRSSVANNVNIQKVEYKVDGRSLGFAFPPNFALNWKIDDVASGTQMHHLTVLAKDTSGGRIEILYSDEITVENVPPVPLPVVTSTIPTVLTKPVMSIPEAPSVAPRFIIPLRRGTNGADVKLLQKFLARSADVYPEGLVTGYFGPLTEAAVKRFQIKYGIEAVGIVGPKTRSKLNELAQ